ncbi:MAG TPA: hypothetical protein VEF04_05370, partial [Blastocatellia bacterium]|nr:hypothetical protein [Blastocatellia bacterium]
MMRRMIAFLFVSGLLVGLGNRASACTCSMPQPPCEAYWQAAAVFVGQVTAIKAKQGERDWGRVQVSFTVQEALRGVTGEQIEIFTGMGGGDCGYSFQRGGLYLVYAHRNEATGHLSTSICSRTRRFAEDSEDMHYMRLLAKAKSGAFIFGKVTLNPYPTRDAEQRPQPLANLQVTIEGKERRLTAITDGEGNYRLEGVQPGKYKVLIERLPAGVLANEPTEVTLSDKGCAEVSFWLRREGGRLRGKVFDPQGHPVPGVEIFLMPTDKNNYGADSIL